MSAVPEGIPDFAFDLEPERTYDPAQIAEQVMWPLVDAVWWGDWRKDGHVGSDWHIPKRSNSPYGQLDVTVGASKDFSYGEPENDQEGIPSISSAILEVETIVTDARKNMVLTAAKEDEIEDDDEAEDKDQCEDKVKVSECDEEDLIAKIGLNYIFYSNGKYLVASTQSVQDIDGEILWYDDIIDGPEEEEDGQDAEAELKIVKKTIVARSIFDHDMDMIEAGLYIFNTPAAIICALKVIRANPVIPKP